MRSDDKQKCSYSMKICRFVPLSRAIVILRFTSMKCTMQPISSKNEVVQQTSGSICSAYCTISSSIVNYE